MATATATAAFLADFDGRVRDVRARAADVPTAAAADAQVAVLDALHADLAAAVHDLPAYDVRRANEALAEVAADLQRRRDALEPPRPFRFRARRARRPPPATVARSAATEGAGPAAEAPPRAEAAADPSAAVTVADEGGEGAARAPPRVFAPGSLRGRDVALERLRGVTLALADVSGAVRGSDLVDCALYIGPVAGSVHLSRLTRCDVHVAARQVRLHDSEDVRVFALAASAPVIERCRRMSFAPYALEYSGLSSQVAEAGLESAAAHIEKVVADVKDFSWLQEGQSPNWTVIPVEERPPPVVLALDSV